MFDPGPAGKHVIHYITKVQQYWEVLEAYQSRCPEEEESILNTRGNIKFIALKEQNTVFLSLVFSCSLNAHFNPWHSLAKKVPASHH